MGFIIEPIPDPESLPALKPLLDHKEDLDFVNQLKESLAKANHQAKKDGGLDPALYEALPLKGMNGWPGVNMTHETGRECNKGDEFGYFTFGGSDIIVLTQKGTNPRWNPAFVEGTSFYSLYGTLLGRVTPFE